MRSRRRKQDDAGVDMTPMLDIVFILLIFFIVTAVFVQERTIDMRPPPQDDTPPKEDSAPVILIQVNERNLIFVNGTLTDKRRVGLAIESLRADNGESAVLIVPDEKADHGIVVTVLDSAKGTGAPALIQRKGAEGT